MALFGGWYADQRWQTMTRDLELEMPVETDWISIISAATENGIRFFQGATADSVQ